jgi:hypothetical protein
MSLILGPVPPRGGGGAWISGAGAHMEGIYLNGRRKACA